jgi:hypothetical protein
VGAHDTDLQQPPAQHDERAPNVLRLWLRDLVDHEAGGVLEQHAIRGAVAAAADDAAGWVRRGGVDRCGRQRRVAREKRVVIERPDGDLPARCGTLHVVGAREDAPAALVPAEADQPAGRVDPLGCGSEDRHRRLERRRGREVDMIDRERGIDEVDVRVDDPGHRDLAGLELDPAGVRVGTGLEVDGRAREGDLAVADPDRLDPAKAGIAGERGDPTAGDEHVEWHQLDAATTAGGRGAASSTGPQPGGSASSSASAGRSRPAPSPAARAIRALGPVRWPASSAPARCHVAPPPGKA